MSLWPVSDWKTSRQGESRQRQVAAAPGITTLALFALLACATIVGAASPPEEVASGTPTGPPLRIGQTGQELSQEEYLAFVAEDLRAAFDELRSANSQAAVDAVPVLDEVARARADQLAAAPRAQRLPPKENIWRLMEAFPELRLRRVHEQIEVFGQDLDPTEGVLSSWDRSEETRRSLLDPELDGVGVGVAESGDGDTIVVVVYTLKQTALNDLDELEERVQFLVERERKAHGLKRLRFLAELKPIARAHSQDMGLRRFFDHDNPDGKSPGDRARDAGHAFAMLAENLGVSYEIETPIESIVQGWMESPGHRRNILDKRFTHTAVGIAFSETGEIFITQLFSRPLRPPATRTRKQQRKRRD